MRVNVSQRQVILFMFAIQLIGLLLVMLQVFLTPGSTVSSELIVGFAVLLFASMFAAYWYGWQPARYVVIIAITLIVALTLDNPATSTPPITLALPPLIALVMGGPLWVIGSGLLQLIVLIIRSGGEGVYTNPGIVVIYAMIISGPVLSRLITDSRQREVEAARTAAEEHLQEIAHKSDEIHIQTRLLDAVEQPVVAFDIDKRITFWNEYAHTLYGYTAAETMGHPLSDVFQIRSIDGTGLLPQTPLEESWTGEALMQSKGGTQIPMLVSRSPLRDSAGKLIGGVTVATDITERKQAEISLQQANERLEARVQERTAELGDAIEELRAEISERQRIEATLRQSETHLRQASREAERANAAKNEFLSRMSHELRTPLNAILGFAQLLEMDQLPPEQNDSVEQILKGGKHLLGLIDEVLDISRMEEGRLSVSLEPVELGQVVRECIGMVRPLAAQRNLALNVRLGDAWDVHILADRQRLKQVLVNLLANAVKYNNAGGRVTLAASVAAAGKIRIAVEDTGPGIPADKLERLFTPFDRLGAEQTEIEGTGLGLALSQRLVRLMGGTIGVESEYGQGTTFWVELPQVDSPIEELTNGAPHTTFETPAPDTMNGKMKHKILYIEDNLSNLRLLQRILTHRPQIELVTAMQGQLGLDLARVHQPDLIYLDLHLPDISGHEVLDQLQSDPITRDIPVVVVSADATPRQVERLLATGARAYLTKPLDVRQFYSVLDSTLMPKTQT